MYQELAYVSNAFNARSHLTHSGPSAPGLSLFCQSVEQLKRDLPNTLAGMTGGHLLCECFMRNMCIHLLECVLAGETGRWSRMVVIFFFYKG